MPSLIPGFEYDVFISYRQNDNRSGWVTHFVEQLREELSATLKDSVTIYFDENPHDGLSDTHHVNKSLEGKLNCVLFIPILSRTYCDPKCFAWTNELQPFLQMSGKDQVGKQIHLASGNVSSRVLPVQIHELDENDQALFESATEGALQSIDFTFRTQGVNRPLTSQDVRNENLNRVVFRDQINKLANAVAEIMTSLTVSSIRASTVRTPKPNLEPRTLRRKGVVSSFIDEVTRRNVLRAGIVYIATSILVYLLVDKYVPDAEKLKPLMGFLVTFGLLLALVLAWLFELSPTGWIRTTSPASAENPYRPYQRKPLTGPWIILVLAGLIAYYYLQGEKPVVEDKSIAVLPFENRSDAKGDTYLSDGFTEDVINRLYMIGDLRVISYASTKQYRNSNKTIKEIAAELGVSTILTGSVHRLGNDLKITVQLQDGSKDELIWVDIYQRTVTDVFSVQTEITRRIADVLKIRISDLIESRLTRKPTENLSAYDHFAKGRNLYNYSNSDSMDLAIKQYKMAVIIDPNYAQAYAGLADAYAQLHARFARGIQWIDSAIVAATMAVELDSNSSDGYKALGASFNYARNYDTAFFFFKKAVEMNRNNWQAIGNLGQAYFIRLNYPEALRHYNESSRINPINPVPYQAMGWTYRLLGDYPRAEYYLQKSLSYRPLWDTYRELAFVYLAQSRNQDALKLIDQILELGNRGTRPLEIAGRIAHFAGEMDRAKGYFKEALEKNTNYQNDPNSLSAIALGQILLEQGQSIEAEFYLTRAQKLFLGEIKNGSEDDDPPFNVAAIYAIQNNRTESLRYLQMAKVMRWIDYIQVEKGPYFMHFRNDPDFKKIVESAKEKVSSIRSETVRSIADVAPL